jgi:hypothetical protein
MAEFEDLRGDGAEDFAGLAPAIVDAGAVLGASDADVNRTGADDSGSLTANVSLERAPDAPASSTISASSSEKTENRTGAEEDRLYEYQLALILRDPRNREVLDGKTGENFFPKRPDIYSYSSKMRGDTVSQRAAREQPASTRNYSYRRVLPKRGTANNQRIGPGVYPLANKASFQMPSFMASKLGPDEQKYNLKPEASNVISYPNHSSRDVNRHEPSLAESMPGNRHIPSDAPGFFRDQSIVTSGLVPRSVSREPYSCLAQSDAVKNLSLCPPMEKSQKFGEDIYAMKRMPGRRRFLVEIPRKGGNMRNEQDFQAFYNGGTLSDSHEGDNSLGTPGYVKDPESVSDGVLGLWESSAYETPSEGGDKIVRNSKEKWHWFKRKPLVKHNRKDSDLFPALNDVAPEGNDAKLELVVDNNPASRPDGDPSADGTSCFAISEEGKAPVIIPFTKDSNQSKVLPPILPDYKESKPAAVKIPVVNGDTTESNKWRFGSGVKWFISFVGIATIVAGYFSYKHKDKIVNLWKNPIGINAGIAAERLSLERVSYSLAKEGGSSKITLVGEIVNNNDSTLNVPLLRVKIFSTEPPKLLATWDYNSNLPDILPNEHSSFRIERALPLDPDQDLTVEVSFTQIRQPRCS